MHLQMPESAGPATDQSPTRREQQLKPLRHFEKQSSSLPFGQEISFSSIAGPTYVTGQTLVQQVAYALSDKIFTYSPDTFDLDVAVKRWSAQGELNVHGHVTGVSPMQIRSGAGSIALGYLFSNDFDVSKRHIPQSLIGSTASLSYLRATIDQLSLLYSVASPFVAHIAAVDYTGAESNALVSDYAGAMALAEEVGTALVSSSSAYELQHMSLFSTLLAEVLPTIHIYDGIFIARETLRVIDVLDPAGLCRNGEAISREMRSKTTKRDSIERKTSNLLGAFNDELGTGYELFEYHGSDHAESVLVVFGTVEASLAAQVADKLVRDCENIGVICVRVYRPFVEDEFLKNVPASVRNIKVLGQVHSPEALADDNIHSGLYNDVLAAVTFGSTLSNLPTVSDLKYPRGKTWSPSSIAACFKPPRTIRGAPQQSVDSSDVAETAAVETLRILDPSTVQQYTFWDSDNSSSVDVPAVIAKFLARNASFNITIKSAFDNLKQGGIIRTDVRSSKKTVEASYPIEEADVVFVGNESILNSVDVTRSIKEGGSLILCLAGISNDDIEKKLSASFRRDLCVRKIQLIIVDTEVSAEETNDEYRDLYLKQLAFLHVVNGDTSSGDLNKLASINGNEEVLHALSDRVENVVHRVTIPDSWADVEEKEERRDRLPGNLSTTSFSRSEQKESSPPSLLSTWETAAKGLVFKEAFNTRTALRPDLSVKTWTVRVKENRRLTPASYDRNIFHIEFDLGQSGLKYDIGEALGIHGENDESQVEDFIRFYGLDADEIVEVPSREDANILDKRTVYQALLQNLDIFGRPPKRFYEDLAYFADNDDEKKELLALGGPEGAVEFKRRAEVDTVTYADVLLEFPSAHPSFHDIARIVSPMKRREYSIASSQKVNPTSVALLIVVVDWIDTKGRKRFGQATRYLNSLRVGDAVTVSVKASVMKLPPSSTQPLIMSGLGTGLAPFRAFVQHRAWEKAQGKEIGAVLLYMGARHQREEYLYGEEWEAYQDAGVITLLGRAFSRDQPQKIYIQDRMRQTIRDIIQAYIEDEGAFYLCGPTWPVPDVTEVLQEAITLHAASTTTKKVDARKEIEKLKEDLRYVLEVY
ncbi:MAG: hypothetical protein M1825_001930 [Sarcosagium campestre]|nr:MAG: hypothetical protein M1825_001930 [Sarcosagium campestre]